MPRNPSGKPQFWTLLICLAFGQTMAAVAQSSAATPERQGDEDETRDLLVYGSTPGGIALAVRAAREGLDVQLVTHAANLGGMLSNGLSTMDTLYQGRRSPLYDELRRSIYMYYRDEYGEESSQYRATRPGYPKTRYEARVAEMLIEKMLGGESRLDVVRSFYPVSAKSSSGKLSAVVFREMDSSETITVRARYFADCSYEADLIAVAGIPYRIGRESRDAFQEEHAGVLYMRREPWPPSRNVDTLEWRLARSLKLVRYRERYAIIDAASSGAAHPSVQGYNMRTIITRDPDNRIPIERPRNYDADLVREFGFGNPDSPGLSMPNEKFGLNEPKLVGQQDPYVEGDWQTRRLVAAQHREATLSLLYFRQNDPSVPPETRRQWRRFGLPKDEFPDNGHMPYEIYARETRRIVGRETFTENNARLAPGLERAPIVADSISITEWFLDSHACTPRRVGGSEGEGKVMLKNQTFPGQVSFRAMLPENVENVIVPVCLSATHVGWGAIRLEPTWMSIAEAAAHAVAMASEQNQAIADVDVDRLQRELAEQRVLLTFFNDTEGLEESHWYPAIQYLGTKGFFSSYEAHPETALAAPLARAWIERAGVLLAGNSLDANAAAREMQEASSKAGPGIVGADFAAKTIDGLSQWPSKAEAVATLFEQLSIPHDKPVTRGDASRLIYEILKQP